MKTERITPENQLGRGSHNESPNSPHDFKFDLADARAAKQAPCRTANKANEERRALWNCEAARTFGLSRSTLYRLLKLGKLTTVKIGARRLVPVGAIDALLNEGAR